MVLKARQRRRMGSWKGFASVFGNAGGNCIWRIPRSRDAGTESAVQALGWRNSTRS